MGKLAVLTASNKNTHIFVSDYCDFRFFATPSRKKVFVQTTSAKCECGLDVTIINSWISNKRLIPNERTHGLSCRITPAQKNHYKCLRGRSNDPIGGQNNWLWQGNRDKCKWLSITVSKKYLSLNNFPKKPKSNFKNTAACHPFLLEYCVVLTLFLKLVVHRPVVLWVLRK